MRFARIHKVASYVLAVLGLVALTTGGELAGLPSIALGLGVIASWFAEGEILRSGRYTRAWNGALVALLAMEVTRAVFFHLQPLTAAVEFASFLQLSRLANRRSARDYQQITVLALLHLIAATVLGGGLSYAACFVGFVIATPWALTLGHLRREIEGNYLADARAGRSGVPIDVARILRSRRVVGPGLLIGSSLLSLPIFVITAALFVLFPRIGLGIFSFGPGRSTSLTGLGSEVSLAGHGTIRSDPTIVLRIVPPDLGSNPPTLRSFRLRGVAFDHYNGRAWWREMARSTAVERVGSEYRITRWARERPNTQGPRDLAYRIVLDPIDPPVVLVPPGTVAVRVEPRMQAGEQRFPTLTMDGAREIRHAGNDDLGIVYTAMVDASRAPVDDTRLSADDERRYLQLPALAPRVRALARTWAAGATTPAAMARAIESQLQLFRYTLDVPSGRAAQPLEDFLFRTRAGHCEYFSTALAVLLRTLGVPTRNVTGFYGGAYNRYGGFYAIRNGDAHSWVEVYDPGHGWLTFDPTPAAREASGATDGLLAPLEEIVEALRVRWRRYVVGFDLGTQARIAMRVFNWFEARRRTRGVDPATPRDSSPRSVSQTARSAVRDVRVWIVLAAVATGLIVWRVQRRRARRGGSGVGPRTPHDPRVQIAIALARSLDTTFESRGHVRPKSRSPLAHASDLARSGSPMGELAVEVARRYVDARFGDEPLEPSELETWRRKLRDAPGAAP